MRYDPNTCQDAVGLIGRIIQIAESFAWSAQEVVLSTPFGTEVWTYVAYQSGYCLVPSLAV